MASAAKKARVLRTPADEVEDLVEQQRAQRDKMKELQRRHEAEKEDLRRRQEAEMEGLRGEEAELKRREAEAHGRTDLSPVSIGDLPEPALRRILLGPSDSLLRHVAACARVCAEWRRVVGGSAAYGLGLPQPAGDEDERARLLKAITRALEAEEDDSMLRLGSKGIGDAGAAVLGVALQAMPRIRFTRLDLGSNKLTATGVASLAPALRRPWGDGGLQELWVSESPLGDAGLAALFKALPPTLEWLDIESTGCGDDGLVALAAVLPTLACFGHLDCSGNRAATSRGWVALASALPSLPALETLYLHSNPGMGSEGGAALVAAIPRCTRLCEVTVADCGLGKQTAEALEALARPDDHPLGDLSISVE